MTGWYDTFLEGTLDAFDRLAGSEPARPQEGRARLVIGPWTHSPWGSRAGQRSFGPEAALSVDELHVRWFDRWLKDRRGDQAEGTIRYFEMGSGRWREDDTWPPRAMRHESWYLHSAGAANTSDGDGELVRGLPQDDPPDMIVHDPGSPVPSLGGSSCCDERLAPMGSYDQSPIQHRPDVLVYISEALAEEIEIAGQVRARLFYRSSRPALDWVATLAVTTPSGEVYNLCDGIWRSTGAEGSERDLERGSWERVAEVDLGSIANRFAKGERICLQVAGSSFPAYGVNPGAGSAHPLEWPVGTPTTQTLFHDMDRPSAIELPLVVREDGRS